MTTTARAKKGGEYGANGEWYEGGKFINTVKENAKRSGSAPKGKGRKVQVEPGVWVYAEGNQKPLLSWLGAGAVWANGKMVVNHAAFGFNGRSYFGQTVAQMQTICDRYNAGERWQ